MVKDFHREDFKDSTLTKLELFRRYLQEWLPVFIRPKAIWPKINIFDLFAGPGTDTSGTLGSPLIILEELAKFKSIINSEGLTINAYFNDKDQNKIQCLQEAVSSSFYETENIKITYSGENFENLFYKYLPLLQDRGAANFLFLDQTGIAAVTENVFQEITGLRQTDLLFFVSSSYVTTRFPDSPAMKQYINVELSNDSLFRHWDSHRKIWEHYKMLIPKGITYYIAPFSLRRDSNIHGLIFGSGHSLGYEKFLKVSWEVDPFNGEANFNIDNDVIVENGQTSFLPDIEKSKRLREFEASLEKEILQRTLTTNYSISDFSLLHRFLPTKHANPVVTRMKKEGKILNKGRIGLSRKAKKQIIEISNHG